MVWKVKELAAKSDTLTSIPETHIVEGGNLVLSHSQISINVTCACIRTHTHRANKIVLNFKAQRVWEDF